MWILRDTRSSRHRTGLYGSILFVRIQSKWLMRDRIRSAATFLSISCRNVARSKNATSTSSSGEAFIEFGILSNSFCFRCGRLSRASATQLLAGSTGGYRLRKTGFRTVVRQQTQPTNRLTDERPFGVAPDGRPFDFHTTQTGRNGGFMFFKPTDWTTGLG